MWSSRVIGERDIQNSRLSHKWLEVFRLAAQSGSMQTVATETGLSVSTVSHHLRSLEDQLGVSLIDRSRRPMALTLTCNVFLNDIEEALRLIRKAEVEATSGNMSEARSLRLGLVEDFDSEIALELARLLAAGMQSCEATHYTCGNDIRFRTFTNTGTSGKSAYLFHDQPKILCPCPEFKPRLDLSHNRFSIRFGKGLNASLQVAEQAAISPLRRPDYQL